MVYLVVLIWFLGGVVAFGCSCWFCWFVVDGYFLVGLRIAWFWCGCLLLCLLDGWTWW